MYSKIFATVLCTVLLFEAAIIPAISAGKVRSTTVKAGPYFMPFGTDPQPVDQIIKAGVKNLILAFVLAANHHECHPAWDGEGLVEHDKHVLDIVHKIRAAGGDVVVSFGGASGTELARACKTPEQLAEAYQKVIDKYDLKNVDFDIEGDALGKAEEETRRFHAINILRKHAAAKGRQLHVSLTIPFADDGLDGQCRSLIQRAVDAHCEIDAYTVMAFDYGGKASHQAESVKNGMEHVHHQLKSLRKDLNDSQTYASIGMILMNGHTDDKGENYNQAVFRDLLHYAQSKGLARLAFWVLNRDRPCHKQEPWTAESCSSVPQQPYEFSKIISEFNHHH